MARSDTEALKVIGQIISKAAGTGDGVVAGDMKRFQLSSECKIVARALYIFLPTIGIHGALAGISLGYILILVNAVFGTKIMPMLLQRSDSIKG